MPPSTILLSPDGARSRSTCTVRVEYIAADIDARLTMASLHLRRLLLCLCQRL
jgi:hypothetical protein